MISINKKVFAKIDGWSIIFYDEDDKIVNMCAIPVTEGTRRDIIHQEIIQKDGGYLSKIKYHYNYKDNIKELKGNKIIISITNGKPLIGFLS